MGERLTTTAKRTKENVKAVAAVLGIGATAVFATGCASGGDMSKKEATKFAVEDYSKTFTKASPAGRFVLQYLSDTRVDILKKNGGQGQDNQYYHFDFSNGCLQNTAYDIAGGRINGSFSGFFSGGEINGRVPTAAANAYVDPESPNTLVIESGHASSHDLRFAGALPGATKLTPLDEQTKSVLYTYGCIPNGGYDYSLVEKASGDTSPFVTRTLGDEARPGRPSPQQ